MPRHKRFTHWTKSDIAKALRERQQAGLSGPIWKTDAALARVAQRHFGTISAAFAAAGLPAPQRNSAQCRQQVDKLPGATFAERVRLRQQSLGMTQLILSSRSGLARNEIEYIESGKRTNGWRMHVGTALRLARALGTRVEALFDAGP